MRVTSIGAMAVVAIVLVSVVAVVGNYAYNEWIKKTKSEAQMRLSEAEATLVDGGDALNPAPPSMQDLIKSLKESEEYLAKAKTAFDDDRYNEALNLAETAKKIAEETIMRAKGRVEEKIQTVEEMINEIGKSDDPPRATTLLLGKAQDLLGNAKKEYENKEYGLAQEFAVVGKMAADNAMINMEKVENAERKVERIEELKRTFEQELRELIATTLEEARKQLENARELPDGYLSNGSAENAKRLSENVLRRMSELALEEIHEAEKTITLVENMMDISNCYPHAVTVLVNKAKEILSSAEGAYEEGKYGQAFGQAHAAKMLARNALRILEEKLRLIAEQENYLKTAVVEVVAGSPVDTTPPTIHRVWVEPTMVTFGESITIYIDATDDLSGISEVWAHVNDAWGRIQGGTMVWDRTPEGVWYVTVNYVKKYTPAGIWTVDVGAGDDVGNDAYIDNAAQFIVTPSEIVVNARLIEVPTEVESGENFSVLINVNNTTNVSLKTITIRSYIGDLTLGVDEVNLAPYENKILIHSAVLSDVKPGEYTFGITAMYEGRISEDKRSIRVVPRIDESHQELEEGGG